MLGNQPVRSDGVEPDGTVRRLLRLFRRVEEYSLKQLRSRVHPLLRAVRRPRFDPDPSSDVVISFTSFPARIGAVWAVVDTLFLQDAGIKAVVLVLSEEEFPDRRLPASLRRRVERGLAIEWILTNHRSYTKLLPALKSFATERIVVVDDDKLYPRSTIGELVRASDHWPAAVIGHRGRSGQCVGGRFRLVDKADSETPSKNLLLAGNGGVIYPPGALHPDVVDYGLAQALCPTHDDVWFWAMAVRAGTTMRCLGTLKKPVRLLAQEGTPALSAINDAKTENRQIDAVVEQFRLLPLLDPELATDSPVAGD